MVFRIVSRKNKKKPADLQRVFQIGFNKAGSTSLHKFFQNSGLSSVHWRAGQLAKSVQEKIILGQDPIADYSEFSCFTDMFHIDNDVTLEPFKNFKYLHHWYPDALFILNTRNIDSWIASRIRHRADTLFEGDDGSLLNRSCQYYGLSEEDMLDYWRADWLTHHANVRAYFKTSERFFELNLDSARLCGDDLVQFLKNFFTHQKWAEWPHENPTTVTHK